MVRGLLLAVTLAASALALAQAPTFGAVPSLPPASSEKLEPCTSNSEGPCRPTHSSRKQAVKAFKRAQDEQKDGKVREAFADFNKASSLSPDSFSYATAREFAR